MHIPCLVYDMFVSQGKYHHFAGLELETVWIYRAHRADGGKKMQKPITYRRLLNVEKQAIVANLGKNVERPLLHEHLQGTTDAKDGNMRAKTKDDIVYTCPGEGCNWSTRNMQKNRKGAPKHAGRAYAGHVRWCKYVNGSARSSPAPSQSDADTKGDTASLGSKRKSKSKQSNGCVLLTCPPITLYINITCGRITGSNQSVSPASSHILSPPNVEKAAKDQQQGSKRVKKGIVETPEEVKVARDEAIAARVALHKLEAQIAMERTKELKSKDSEVQQPSVTDKARKEKRKRIVLKALPDIVHDQAEYVLSCQEAYEEEKEFILQCMSAVWKQASSQAVEDFVSVLDVPIQDDVRLRMKRWKAEAAQEAAQVPASPTTPGSTRKEQRVIG